MTAPVEQPHLAERIVSNPASKLAGGGGALGLMLWMGLTVQSIQTDVRHLLMQGQANTQDIAQHAKAIERVESAAGQAMDAARACEARLNQHEAEFAVRQSEWRAAMDRWESSRSRE